MKLLTRMKVAAMAVVCALVANVASAATATVNGVTYEYQVVGNTVTIGTGEWNKPAAISTSTRGALVIPSRINGYPVTRINDRAFEGCEKITSVTIPNSVKSIGHWVFSDMSLTTLEFPESLEELGLMCCYTLKVVMFKGPPPQVDPAYLSYSDLPTLWYDEETVGYYPAKYAKQWKAAIAKYQDSVEDWKKRVEWYDEESWEQDAKFCKGWYGLTMKQKSGGSDNQPKPSYGIFDSAQTFNGWLNSEYGYIDGAVQIKTSKATANRKTGVVTSKATATIQYLDWSGNEIKLKKATYSGMMEIEDECGYLEVEGRSGDSIYIEVSADGVYGDFRAPSGDISEIIAYRDLFSSRDTADKARAAEALAKWKKTFLFALDDCCAAGKDFFNVTIGTMGKTKVSGTLLEQKFNLTTQLIVGEDRCYLPMVAAKGYGFHRLLYLEDDGTISDGGEYLSESLYGTPKPLESGDYNFFVEDVNTLAYLVGGWTYDVYTEYIPEWWNSVRLTTKGSMWVLPKAGKVVLDRYGDVDESKLGENPAGLKLSYKAKDGTFSGSFKAYVNKNGRPSAVTVSVSGVMIGRVGYGTATVKRLGSVPVRINHETVLGVE